MSENFDEIIDKVTQSEYEYGWTTDVETEYIPKGLSEDTIRLISQKKREPEWMLEHRLDAYRHWLTLEMPDWAHLDIPEIDFQEVIYFAQPKKKKSADEEMDPELERTFEKLGIPVNERKALAGYAVDAW